MLRILGTVFAVLVLASIGDAQRSFPSPTPTPERPRAIVALLNDARLAAPELAVDTFLKVVESKKVTDAVWRREIIDEALRMIDDVQYQIPLRLAYGGQNELNDTEPYLRAAASNTKLDRLSLKGRAILQLLDIDRDRAKQAIFQMGGDLGLKPRSCEDVLTYSPDDIYPVVAKVAAASFSQEQISEGRRALFLAPWVENIDSPTQIFPAIDLLRQFQASAAEKQILFNAFSKAVDKHFKDDRSFTNSMKWSIPGRISKLVVSDSDPLKAELVIAYRSMLLKNLRGTRCTDNEIKKDQPPPDYIESANKLFGDKPLTFEDVIASEISGTAKIEHMLTKYPMLKKLRDEGVATKGGTIVDNKLVKHDQTDAEWVSRVNNFMDRLLAYDGADGESEVVLLANKSSFLTVFVMEAVEPGELRKSLVRKFLRLLANLPLQRTSFIEWSFWVQMMERADPADFAEIAAEFPNPNLKVMLATKKVVGDPAKEKAPAPPPPAKAAEEKPAPKP